VEDIFLFFFIYAVFKIYKIYSNLVVPVNDSVDYRTKQCYVSPKYKLPNSCKINMFHGKHYMVSHPG
jgi:hypothetical protein